MPVLCGWEQGALVTSQKAQDLLVVQQQQACPVLSLRWKDLDPNHQPNAQGRAQASIRLQHAQSLVHALKQLDIHSSSADATASEA